MFPTCFSMRLGKTNLDEFTGIVSGKVVMDRAETAAGLWPAAGNASGDGLTVTPDAAPEFQARLELHRTTVFSELERHAH